MNNDITIDPEEIRKLPDNSVDDYETIRQIALYGLAHLNEEHSDLYRKIKKGFEYMGLYPQVITNLNIMPEDLKNCEELPKKPKEIYDFENRPQYIAGSCIGEKCFCGKDAYHRVGEVIFDDDPCPIRHELTSYICCEHFQMIFGNVAKIHCMINKHNV